MSWLLGRTRAEAGRTGRRPGEAAHQRRRPRFGRLAHRQHRHSGYRIGKAHLGDLEGRPARSALAAPVPHRGNAGGADGNADGAEPPGPAGAIRNNEPQIALKVAIETLLESSRTSIGILRQKQHALSTLRGSKVGLIDTGIGDDKTPPGGDDQNVGFGAQHLAGVTQHGLDQARVLAGDVANSRARSEGSTVARSR